MVKLKANCLKTGGAPWLGRCHKAEFGGGNSDTMQAKEKK